MLYLCMNICAHVYVHNYASMRISTNVSIWIYATPSITSQGEQLTGESVLEGQNLPGKSPWRCKNLLFLCKTPD